LQRRWENKILNLRNRRFNVWASQPIGVKRRQEASDILTGETVFLKYYGAAGNEEPSSGMWTWAQWLDQQSRGALAKERAWNWFGEVFAS
jgi:hypothetical protein